MSKHTPEPWYVGACRPEHEEKGLICTGIRAGQYRAGVSAPDLRRIVACVNACQGLSTEALEAGALKEAVDALRDCADWLCDAHEGTDPWERGDNAAAALAKLEGK